MVTSWINFNAFQFFKADWINIEVTDNIGGIKGGRVHALPTSAQIS